MINIKTDQEIEIMKEGGKLLAKILQEVANKVIPGITTKELDRIAEDIIEKAGAKPSFKGCEGFPATMCTSVNEVVVHGAPSNYVLKEGDIISLDLGLEYKGFHSDMAVTVPVGEIDSELRRMIKVARKALKRGISASHSLHTLGDIGNTIQRYVESQGFGVVKDLCGHGIGRSLHEDPQIPNYGKRKKGQQIKEGMVICLEPMITMGSPEVERSKDGSYVTVDGSCAAHFEHTIAITKSGPKVLTE